MKTYAAFGFTDFVLALGYRGQMIKDFFVQYDLLDDFTLELGNKIITPLRPSRAEASWRITFVDTGQETMTGGRLLRLRSVLAGEQDFMLTYGDGVTDLNIASLLEFHRRSARAVTVTGVRAQARFGELQVEGDQVIRFLEKPRASSGWISGGYFVMTPAIFDYLHGDATVLEKEPLERLAAAGQMAVFKHEGYWQCMDTVRDMQLLNREWAGGNAPWRRWEDSKGDRTNPGYTDRAGLGRPAA
jgi:glucose-1-phosphate cytidylyltransferase